MSKNLLGFPIKESDDLPAVNDITLGDLSAYGPGITIDGIFYPLPEGWKKYRRIIFVFDEDRSHFEGSAGFDELGHEIWEEIK